MKLDNSLLRRAAQLFSFTALVYFPVIAPVLASSPDVKDTNCHEKTAISDANRAKSASAVINQSMAVSAATAVPAEDEVMLESALYAVKHNNLGKAVTILSKLTAQFPDNADYGLLYRMAMQRQDGEGWYRFQKWVAKKQEPPEFMRVVKASGRKNSESKLTAQEERINALKRETWLLLAGGVRGSASSLNQDR